MKNLSIWRQSHVTRYASNPDCPIEKKNSHSQPPTRLRGGGEKNIFASLPSNLCNAARPVRRHPRGKRRRLRHWRAGGGPFRESGIVIFGDSAWCRTVMTDARRQKIIRNGDNKLPAYWQGQACEMHRRRRCLEAIEKKNKNALSYEPMINRLRINWYAGEKFFRYRVLKNYELKVTEGKFSGCTKNIFFMWFIVSQVDNWKLEGALSNKLKKSVSLTLKRPRISTQGLKLTYKKRLFIHKKISTTILIYSFLHKYI